MELSEQLVASIVELAKDNLAWAGIALSVLTFIDGLVIVGFVINGWGAFALCLYLYAQHSLSIFDLVVYSAAGVVAGEQLSYALCRRYNASILSLLDRLIRKSTTLRNTNRFWRLFLPSSSPEQWDAFVSAMRRRVARWGGAALLVGRWTPFASMVPSVCALLSMQYVRFSLFSVCSCLLWASGWMLVVYLTVRGYIAWFS
jgi:membrane protein DedA with SNARE-associated domain